jgi:hypothetical protein
VGEGLKALKGHWKERRLVIDNEVDSEDGPGKMLLIWIGHILDIISDGFLCRKDSVPVRLAWMTRTMETT